MDALRPGHAHRSSSDRLLNNYLDSQKNLSASLLTLLSQSHSSTSSLLAYVTSSPGVTIPIRRAVRHAAFEGPLSVHDNGGSQLSTTSDTGAPGWAAYIGSLEQFRKDLKQIHLLEEELSRVKRDREILVTRLIKTTKSRPTKNDIKDIATSYSRPESAMSSRDSVYSADSNTSGTIGGKESKRAGKLAEAQAELLGCEEHLRGLEVRIEAERNKVMLRGLEGRFQAMEVVGHMWVAQARRGLEDLGSENNLLANSFELDSNGSIAPSQSASQIGHEDISPSRKHFPHQSRVSGSITGSIAEEDEETSDDEQHGNLVMHENRPASRQANGNAANGHASRAFPHKPSPLGVPSVTAISAHNDSDSDTPNPRRGGRRAASDVGAMGYRPPRARSPLKRTFSASGPARRGGSDTASVRSGGKKKGAFGRFFSKLFGGGGVGGSPSHARSRSGRDSPTPGKHGAWQTRTDANIKRASTTRGHSRADESSSDEDDRRGNFMSVSNNRDSTWTVESVGVVKKPAQKANGSKPTRSDLGAGARSSSQSTVRAVPASSKPTVAAAVRPPSSTGKAHSTAGMAPSTISRSNTVRSTTSQSTAKGKTRNNGSISRATSLPASDGRNIMNLIDPPVMPEVARAPKSQVTPQLELARAPGSSIAPAGAGLVLPSQITAGHLAPADELHPHHSISRNNSLRKDPSAGRDAAPARPVSPLPPSRTLSPPTKSAMRPTSPAPPSAPLLSPPPNPPTLVSITAPGPVVTDSPKPEEVEPADTAALAARPSNQKRNSYQSVATTGDEASIYESAFEDEGAGYGPDDSSDDEGTEIEGYNVVENERVKRRNEIAGDNDASSDHTEVGDATAHNTHANAAAATVPPPNGDAGVSRRKSVRMNVPESPTSSSRQVPTTTTTAHAVGTTLAAAPTPATVSPAPDSPPGVPRKELAWDSRVGRQDDSSESDDGAEYARARRGLSRNSGRWEMVKDGSGKESKLKKEGARLKKKLRG
ncbi:hypothetical protein Q5752_000138 [Cryptotrichosporon argae]